MDIIESKTWVEWLITIAKFGFCFVPVLYILLLIPMERRGAGFMQDRQGPNRSYIKIPYFGKIRLFGYVQNMCDGTKLFFKEMFAPAGVNRVLYYVAPAIPFAIVFLSPCVIPWFGPMVFEWSGKMVRIPGSIIDSDVGVLLLFGLSSLSAYGAVLAGWASKSKYSFLGALRTSSMTISYEVCLGLSLMGILLLAGSFNLTDIVTWQEHHVWGIVAQPVAFFCFLIASIAETGRAPFDVAEGEPELVAGYHTEYGAMQFGLFYMGEYSHICINSFLIATLFLGGYAVPFVTTETMQAHMGGSLAVLCGIPRSRVPPHGSPLLEEARRYDPDSPLRGAPRIQALQYRCMGCRRGVRHPRRLRLVLLQSGEHGRERCCRGQPRDGSRYGAHPPARARGEERHVLLGVDLGALDSPALPL